MHVLMFICMNIINYISTRIDYTKVKVKRYFIIKKNCQRWKYISIFRIIKNKSRYIICTIDIVVSNNEKY